MFIQSKLIVVFTAAAALTLVQSASAQTTAGTKVYRGSVGPSHIQMTLSFNGSNVTGKYSYDSVGEDIKLTGRVGADGKLELTEVGEKNKPTGKFNCKRPLDDPTEQECYWAKPDGTRETFVTLTEQYIALTGGLQIAPKLITNRKRGIGVSYPQFVSNGTLSAAAQKFNRRILTLTQKAIADFQPIEDDKGTFDTNYNVLLATNDLISIEMVEYYDGGGAHPNDRWWSLTYDLAANKELQFEDLFKPGSDYNKAIAKFVTTDINRRADELEKTNARREGREPKLEQDPLIEMEELQELSGWALTPKGLIIYFDFPHVMAFFDKNFVPYSVVSEYLKPDGPASRFKNN
jgi:uncharacterized protein DUF3298